MVYMLNACLSSPTVQVSEEVATSVVSSQHPSLTRRALSPHLEPGVVCDRL